MCFSQSFQERRRIAREAFPVAPAANCRVPKDVKEVYEVCSTVEEWIEKMKTGD
jgi:hypothetical protein